ncbi:MAG: hypothetical protein DI534_04020 [Leifsonia xyli]|nr:MAG: hypothetical protein DI534_04020 [Leifsonia xyli]
MASWFLIAAPLAIAGLAAVLFALGSTLTTRPNRALPLVRAGGIVVAVVVAGFALVTAATTLVADTVTASFPVQTLPLEAPPGVDFLRGPAAAIVSGGLDHATAQLTGLSIATRALLASGTLLWAAMIVVVALTVARLASSVVAGGAFRPGAARAFTVSAVAVFVGGGLSSMLTQLGEWRVSDEALRVEGWGYTGSAAPTSLSDLGWPDPALFLLTFEWWPLLIAFALAVVGLAFRAGELLRARAESAERDAEGLV